VCRDISRRILKPIGGVVLILITGASRGLGKAITERLVEKGEKVVGLARSTESLEIESIKCDVSNYSSVKQAAREVKRMKEPVKAFINAAGIASMNMAVTTDESTVQKLIQTNLVGTIYCCQLFAPIMLRQKYGCFINFSTIAVALALKGESVYAASKAGVEAFSRTFAREMADFNVRVNIIAPGPIRTDLLRGITDTQIEKITSQQIIPKQFEKSDVCDLVELLIDKKAYSLSGQTLNLGGV
jgi:3-oxoacyl-[acyl-carrier protein] reductase